MAAAGLAAADEGGWGTDIGEQSSQVLVLEANRCLRIGEAMQNNKKIFDRKETSPPANRLA